MAGGRRRLRKERCFSVPFPPRMNVLTWHLKWMFCVIEIYRYSSHFPTSCSEYKGVCVCVVILRASVIHGWFGVSTEPPLLCVLVWIVKAVVNKYISKGKRKMLAIRTKRSTSCIVYYCSIVKNKTWWEHLLYLPSLNTLQITAFWKCLVLFCAPGVCEHNDTSTHSAWVVLSCLSYQTGSPVFFWYATPRHIIRC